MGVTGKLGSSPFLFFHEVNSEALHFIEEEVPVRGYVYADVYPEILQKIPSDKVRGFIKLCTISWTNNFGGERAGFRYSS